MLSAKSEVQVDTPEVRVTEWRLAPGSACNAPAKHRRRASLMSATDVSYHSLTQSS